MGLGVLDTDLRYLRVNDLLGVKNGIPTDQHIRRTVREIIPSIAGTIVCRELIATGNPRLNVEMIDETVTQPNVERTWLNSYFPLKSLTGECIGINVVVHDLTEQKRLEEIARKLRPDLVLCDIALPWMDGYTIARTIRRNAQLKKSLFDRGLKISTE